tara:strand:+ start:1339 stop:1932 length:594 start_codon:yes stop_codon:yes gene_type:complete
MAIRLQIRNPDGTFARGNLMNTENVFTKFGSNVIKGGRKILNQKKKRAKGTLFDDFHYTLDIKKTAMQMGFRFGGAEKYWEFIDEGVKGSGGFKGSGRMRGQGSPFRFKTKQPPLSAILGWVKLKGLSGKSQKGIAFAIARTIKQRGLERTQFYTKPINEELTKLPNDLLRGFGKDMDRLISNIPKRMVVVTNKMSL